MIFLAQFSNKLLDATEDRRLRAYYDAVYQVRAPEGYVRGTHWWEVPQWIARAWRSVPEPRLYVVTDMAAFIRDLLHWAPRAVAFSVTEANAALVHHVCTHYNGPIHLGGYVDGDQFHQYPHVRWFPSLPSWLAYVGHECTAYDYTAFTGEPTIPRLALSTGCTHRCTFCAVDRTLRTTPPAELWQQTYALSELPFKLVYVNDKTFGQAGNLLELIRIRIVLEKLKPDFNGFIIQTTANMAPRLSQAYLADAKIRFVELGIESYNDPILKAMKKPATERTIDKAVKHLSQCGVRIIPNIIVGLPGETPYTYAQTLYWLRSVPSLSHVNVYNLAVYGDTRLSADLPVRSAEDTNENAVQKSWHEGATYHDAFLSSLTTWGLLHLWKGGA